MARPKSREAILGEIQQLTTSIDALKKKLTEHDKAEATRIGGLAMKAGLGSIAIPEEALSKAFEELVARFRTEYPEVAQPKAKGRRGARPAPEGADAQTE